MLEIIILVVIFAIGMLAGMKVEEYLSQKESKVVIEYKTEVYDKDNFESKVRKAINDIERKR